MKIIIITQARYGSSRLPGKVLKRVNGKTLLQIHLERALKATNAHKLIVATTIEKEAEQIIAVAQELGLTSYQGSVDDVLDRFYMAAKNENADYVVRITSDCPLIDATIIDEVITACIKGGFDYCTNAIEATYPDGMDVEVIKFSALETAWKNASLKSDREHVTPYISRNSTIKRGEPFKAFNYKGKEDFSKYRLTVDEPRDFEVIRILVEALGEERGWRDYVDYLTLHSDIFEINSTITRNEGYMKSVEQDKLELRSITNFAKSDEYRKKIHNLIPGGAHTYSKGDDQFPALAPAAISHGKGAYVWDIDGNKFLDCSMGLT
ncbi:MAG TPA: hypothetical protein VK174_12880, partial [Chitinophagales bacterium]|nr:hypothetical protein [Chitinophagales bacterium]